MSIKKFDKIESWDQLNQFIQDLYNNLSLSDLKNSDVRTEAPTVDELNVGQKIIVEVSGVPFIYYKTLAGNLYKKQMDVA